MKLKSGNEEKNEGPEEDSGSGAGAYYRLKAAQEKMNEEKEVEEEVEEDTGEEEIKPETDAGERSIKEIVDEEGSENETEFRTTEPRPALVAIVDFINRVIYFFGNMWK